MKGLILAGGTGSRLHPVTSQIPKQLLPVANKPIIFYGIEQLVGAGISEIGIIVSPESSQPIREAVGDGEQFGARVTYITQEQPNGLAAALLVAEDFIAGSPFVMYLGDNLLKDGLGDLVERFENETPEAMVLLCPLDDPSGFGVAECNAAGSVLRVIEKPVVPPSNLALVGVYLFRPSIFEAARQLTPSARGELEITEAIQGVIDSGAEVSSKILSGWWKDTGRISDLLDANKTLLFAQSADVSHRDAVHPSADLGGGGTRIHGNVIIAADAVVEDSTVWGPANIGPGARISNATVGRYSSIGAGAEIVGAEIENSIIGPGVAVASGVVRDSLVYGEHQMLARSEE